MSESREEPTSLETTHARRGWLDQGERGSVFLIRLTVFLVTAFGRAVPRFVAKLVALYYTLASRTARDASRTFLTRLEGRAPSFSRIYRQVLRFTEVTLDAFFLVSGKRQHFTAHSNGTEHLSALREQGRGAILLGAHVGSFYAMRMRSAQRKLDLHAVVYTKNARMMNDALESLDPEGATRLIEMDPDAGLDFMLKIRELVDGGALVAILGDRTHGDARAVEADFLGAKAKFPAGPYLLASLLKCPVYLVFGMYEAPSHYELFCEPFAERIELPRKGRDEALARYVQAYADRLAYYVRRYPENWFNFFDFWR